MSPGLRHVLICLLMLAAGLQERCDGAITIKGAEELGSRLVGKLTEAYRAAGHSVEFQMELRDSSLAFKALRGNRAQIGLSTRPIRASEREFIRQIAIDVQAHVAAVDLMVVVASADNPVSNLTGKQLESAFAGATSDWNRLGGDRIPIKIFTPDRLTETYALFQELALNRKSYASGARGQRSDDDIARNVRTAKGGLGFVGLGAARNRGLKVITIDGVAPSAENVETYPLSRQLYYYTVKQRATSETLDFIRWATTNPQAHKIIVQSGFLPARTAATAAEN